MLLFSIKVDSSPETNDHEVRLYADDVDLVDMFASGLMGVDPKYLLTEPCALRATKMSHYAVIGRCRCGVIECVSAKVEIHLDGSEVIWSAGDTSHSVRFDSAQYSWEIDRALIDFSWETPERTAARKIELAVNGPLLAAYGFEFSWASGRCSLGAMTASLLLKPGPYQVLVRLPWDGQDIDGIVGKFNTLLRQPPECWPIVECNPQVDGLGPPPFAPPKDD